VSTLAALLRARLNERLNERVNKMGCADPLSLVGFNLTTPKG